ncbi:MAG: hypothetical protein ACLPUO_07240 [Streptosporangiaceae bacterium]
MAAGDVGAAPAERDVPAGCGVAAGDGAVVGFAGEDGRAVAGRVGRAVPGEAGGCVGVPVGAGATPAAVDGGPTVT